MRGGGAEHGAEEKDGRRWEKVVLSTRDRGHGFSLVEIIMATSLLSLVMVMMFNLFPTSLLTIRQAEHRVLAFNFAQEVVEQERAASFQSVLIPQVGLDLDGFTKRTGSDNVQYISELLVTVPTDSLFTPPHRLVVTVNEYWNEKNEDPNPASHKTWHTLQAQTYVVDIKS
jgi:type II secretory pathway pseudopilin PulG